MSEEMKEIQEAFEKYILEMYGESYSSLERWNPEWSLDESHIRYPTGKRYYASANLEQDFAFFRAGWFIGGGELK